MTFLNCLGVGIFPLGFVEDGGVGNMELTLFEVEVGGVKAGSFSMLNDSSVFLFHHF